MRILGIETSCDETAVCLLECGGSYDNGFHFRVLGNGLLSQVAVHAPFGGVFPNLAKREHQKNLVPMLTKALQDANKLHRGQIVVDEVALRTTLVREPVLAKTLETFLKQHKKPNVDCIAVTKGPGLEPALWVGINFAKALASPWDLPVVGVNHMEGHVVISAAKDGTIRPFDLPAISLLVSGGHTELVLSREWMSYELIGQTRDDAVGEAYDKVARLMDLPYPGGPEIARLAKQARDMKEPMHFSFTSPMLKSKNFDFSFSGLKTEVRKCVEQHPLLSEVKKREISRAFEDAAAEVLVSKTMRAIDEYGARTLIIGGGVSANVFLREAFTIAIQKSGLLVELRVPASDLATDNALMIALAGYFHAEKQEFSEVSLLCAEGNLKLAK